MEQINYEFIRSLSDLLVKEPSSLEVLLILADEGPKTVKDISEMVIYDTKITDLLDKLIKFDMISIKDGIVGITIYGKCTVKRLRRYKNLIE